MLWMRKDKIYSLRVRADFENLAKLRDFFISHSKKAGLTRKQINDGKLAVDEAVTNVMRHAYEAEKGDILMEIVRTDEYMEVVFKDWGREFDWSSVIDPDLNKYVKIRRKGGLGVWLIKKLTDKVSHERINDMNVLSIRFNIAAEERRVAFSDLFSNIRSRMSISVRFGLIGSTMITAIILGTYFYTQANQQGLATRSFVGRGINAARNVADNGAPYLVENTVNDIALMELLSRITNNVSVIRYITVVNSKDLIVADTNPNRLLTSYNPPSRIRPLGEKSILQQDYLDDDGRRRIKRISVPMKVNQVKIGEVHLGLDMSMIADVEGLAQDQLRTFFITLLVWAVAIVGIIVLTSIFIHPIRKLSRAMALVGSGERNLTEFGGSVSEFSEIGQAFQDMVERLQKSEAQLTDQTRIRKEMQLAKDIQETLLPKEIPTTEGFELAGNYRSALEMGGDYYDFFYVDKHALGLVVGDVSGKGIGAALIMTMVRTAMRTEARGNKRASDVLDKLNKLVANDIKKGMYITMFYVVLDSKKKTINYSSAGHNPMILYRGAEDNVYFLNPKGFAVGLQLPDMNLFSKSIKSENVTLAKGDLLLIYTDGITEAMNDERDQFGEQRLVDFIKANHHLPPKQFSDALNAEISRFTRDYPQSDDITYIVIRRKEDPAVEYYGRVCRLVELVENSNMLLEKVLEKTGFSQEEYDTVMAKYKAKGLKAFKPAGMGIEEGESLSHATLEQSKKIVTIVRRHPAYGSKRIQNMLKTEEFGFEELTLNVINKELKKLKLDTKAKRKHFASRELSENTIYADLE